MKNLYQEKNLFFKELKSEVNEFLIENKISVQRSESNILIAIFLFVLWAIFFFLYLTQGQNHMAWAFIFSGLWALVMLPIQMSVMHDASHGASSPHSFVNKVLSLSISFLGGSAILWKKQHCYAHHSFTNIHNMDHDIDTGQVLRLHYSQPLKRYHKWQHYYAWALYPLFVLSWIWWGDFRDIMFNTYSMSKTQIRFAIFETLLIKVWHVTLFLVIPSYMLNSFWLAISCYLFSFSILGLVMVVVFQLAHISDKQLLPESLKELGNDWAVRQVLTTANFATNNLFLTWFIGGLNFQIEHHIFPHMSHINYPRIHSIVKARCQHEGLQYQSFPTLISAIKGHQRHLIRLGNFSELSTALRK